MLDNVMVGIGTDDEAGEDAIALAQQLVSSGGQLTLVHVLVVTAKPAPDSGAVHATATYRRAIEELTDLARQLVPSAHVACVDAPSVRRGLHELAAAEHADLLVVSSSRTDEVARLLLGDDTTEVLQDPPCPVAVAPPRYAAHSTAIRRIGVAYDGSPESEQALALARSLATDRGAELSAFETAPERPRPRDIWDAAPDHHLDETRDQVAALGGVEAEAELGDPADELARYAPSVDLLVIGSHKSRAIDRGLQQTTAQQLADRTSSPLLVLSSDGARG